MTETLASVAEEQAPGFILPGEAIARLDKIIDFFKSLCMAQGAHAASKIFLMALMAQRKVLANLNDENLYCQVLWDERTGFPSHPSLAADVAKYFEIFNTSDWLKALLNSFSGWSLFRQEKILCCCGRKERIVSLDIMINTILSVSSVPKSSINSSLEIKLLVGVKTDDMEHLKMHYNIKKQSKVDGGLYIIFNCVNSVAIADRLQLHPEDFLTIQPVNFSHADLFSVEEFGGHISKAFQAIAEP